MNPLRIFTRLRHLEMATEILERVQDRQREKTRTLEAGVNGALEMARKQTIEEIKDLDASLRPLLHALHRRIERIEAGMTACARCRGVVMVDQINEGHGPRLMEGMEADGVRRIIVCNPCEPFAKRDGWRVVKLGSALPLTLVPKPKEEAPV